ncbi:hypothetical protein BJF79_28875 [Actinomadura sp. CNU-125]|uniref:hypothetical protein n=1 Tax=Actinomadura sp. CNU-125 TaxID=1904961 RepID=UPI00095C7227|nr:hypothetical protein [Actinomadura sp. CNU-125]OLT37821.1 hypothetical protein BJF79_28875 [Actinomadura sp. CNU-125]
MRYEGLGSWPLRRARTTIVDRIKDVIVSGDEIRAHPRGRLAGYRVPGTVGFWDDLPCTGSGKIRKPAVRERLR